MSKRKVIRQGGHWPPQKCDECGQNLFFRHGEAFCVSAKCNPQTEVTVSPKPSRRKKTEARS